MLTWRHRPKQFFWANEDIRIIVIRHFNGIIHTGIKAFADLKILGNELKQRK